MAKLKDDPITKEDINEYLREYSDFAFEVLVLNKMNRLGFTCEHAGTYEDPITKKIREFDIRARQQLIDNTDIKFDLCLSIECKNLKPNFPLLVHCMPREYNETYIDLIWSIKRNELSIYQDAKRVPIKGIQSGYEELNPVGKNCDQVGRKAFENNAIIGNDADVYDKISQAINASYDLIKRAHYAANKAIDVFTMVVPVLVVPNDRIWAVEYKKSGEIETPPEPVGNVEYYINKSWVVRDNIIKDFQRRYCLSHLEIVQLDNLPEMINKYTKLEIATSAIRLREIRDNT